MLDEKYSPNVELYDPDESLDEEAEFERRYAQAKKKRVNSGKLEFDIPSRNGRT